MQRVHNLKIDDGMIYVDHPTDIFYLLGKKVSAGVLLVFPEETMFFVDSRYIDACKTMKGVDVHLNDGKSVGEMIQKKNPKKVLVDGSTCKFDQYKNLQTLLPEATIESHTHFQQMRAVKDEGEIQNLKKAGSLNHAACMHAISCLKEGVTEKEIAWEYEKFCKERGGEALSFDTIVAFGPNSAYPHYHTGDTKLEKGMPVLIDCGITLNDYTSDMTRSLFFEAEANPEAYEKWKEHYDIVKESYDRAVAKIKPGEMFSVLDEQVQSLAAEKQVKSHVRHTLGHSLGLDVHEWPRITYKLPNIEIKENMVFTIEPGLYFENLHGIRHENTLLVRNGVPEVLSK